MEENELVLLWKEHYGKIEQSLAINQRLLRETINRKARHTLKGLVRIKITGIVTMALYLVFLIAILYFAITHYSSAWNYFIISMGAIFLINLKGLSDYIRHLVWVSEIDYNGSVTEIQQQLARLQLSIIRHARFMYLQIPFWTTFYLSGKWFPQHSPWAFTLVQIVVTLAAIVGTYRLYRVHTPENLDKKWFRKMVAGMGGKSVAKAMDFYRELEDFKKES